MFQFPSNGKAYPKRCGSFSRRPCPGEFQFPSNGKAYPKLLPDIPILAEGPPFQFPSNGKAYPKLNQRRKSDEDRICWKFQFPSNGKAYPKFALLGVMLFISPCFNSLQTGKRIQRKEWFMAWNMNYFTSGFNSLQTGKRIQRLWNPQKQKKPPCWVSIPFKRESVSKGKKTRDLPNT